MKGSLSQKVCVYRCNKTFRCIRSNLQRVLLYSLARGLEKLEGIQLTTSMLLVVKIINLFSTITGKVVNIITTFCHGLGMAYELMTLGRYDRADGTSRVAVVTYNQTTACPAKFEFPTSCRRFLPSFRNSARAGPLGAYW